MQNSFIPLLSATLNLPPKAVGNTLRLLDDGTTIPFISRYRKEATGGLDEVQIADIRQQYTQLEETARRKATILRTIAEQGKLTEELQQRIEQTWDLTILEDLYLPYKPKRRTRAEMARQKGLEPLATELLRQDHADPETLAGPFLSDEVPTVEEALKGARDIIAEKVNEDERARNSARSVFSKHAIIRSKVVKGKESEAEKYRNYFDFSEPLARCSSHRLLAMRRGESEELLRVSILPEDEQACLERVERLFVQSRSACSRQVKEAVDDGCKRLLLPSIETELAASSREKADKEAIRVFANNLKQLLLDPPLGQKRTLAIDPGFRTGCKIVCLDAQGNLLHNETIYPHPPRNERQQAGRKVISLVEKYHTEVMAIGNGTAGRETEQFISTLPFSHPVQVFSVSEDGASVYSASPTAREEFPDYDVTVRGAISIGRRLMDPLAELVKIDPKAIGVGQYQHDVNQAELKQALDQTVEHCVNTVGVNLNTASKHLLAYVSGLGPQLAKNIIEFRKTHGAFISRKQLLAVPRMGPKAYEQCAGFLRIPDATNPLDNTAVHPERYALVEQMARDAGCGVQELIADKKRREEIDIQRYVNAETGLPTLQDILQELDKPGRDPRGPIKVFAFDDHIRTLDDLREGMELPGLVTNITNFGCFVDLGIKEKGLIHVSQLADRYISNPAEVVALHQQVRVKIISLDTVRKRIGLTMKGMAQP